MPYDAQTWIAFPFCGHSWYLVQRFKHIACTGINFRKKKNQKKNCTKINSNCFQFFLSPKSWNLSYEKWENNKTFFGQISGLNKEIKCCLLSFLLKHLSSLVYMKSLKSIPFPSFLHHKPCFHFSWRIITKRGTNLGWLQTTLLTHRNKKMKKSLLD